MSIDQFPKKDNIPLPADLVAGETVSYDKNGEVERFPLFKKLFLSIVLILVASLSFGIGRLSVVGEREPIKIEYDESLVQTPKAETSASVPTKTTSGTASVINAVTPANTVNNQQVVASKNGVRYHFLHCSGAKQIKEENKILFATPEEAKAAGYTLAANCKPR